MDDVAEAGHFTFAQRALPVPGDLRISWRVSILLIILSQARSQRASIAKLHVVNDAVRSTTALRSLDLILAGGQPASSWHMQIEPALGRALDLMVGARLAQWATVAGRLGVAMTEQGKVAARSIGAATDALNEEKAIVAAISGRVTETVVTKIISGMS
jgi:hypothetical protein